MRRNGFVFITSLAVVVLLTMAGTSLFVGGTSQSSISQRIYNRSNALHLAEAGVSQAAINLRTASTADDLTTVTLGSGNFQLAAPQALSGSLTKIIATGTSQQEQRQIEVVYRLIPESVFQFALFGDQQVAITGSAVSDSYDSRLGPYNDDETSPDYNAGHNGDVGTNSTVAGGIAVGGSIFVDGQLALGPNVVNPQSLITGFDPAFITGGTDPPSDTQDVVTQTTTLPMPPVVVPVGLTCSDFTVQGNHTETLSPTGGPFGDGTYCYDDLTIQGGGMLTSTGKVKVYVTGGLMATGNTVVGVPSDPTQMLFMIASTGEATIEGTITGSSQFYGALYAPSAEITIAGNADVYGSIVAEQINVTGSASIHYDEALTTRTDISATYKTVVTAWREL